MADDLSTIHELIQDSLTKEEFNNLVCYHFPDVYKLFTDGQTQDARIRLLIDYANKHQEIPRLLEEIGEKNPKAIADFFYSSSSIIQSMNQLNDNEKSLMYIDFEEGLQIFETTLRIFQAEQTQNNNRVNFALFFIEEKLKKRGDLYLQRLQYEIKSKNHSAYREALRHCHVEYTPGELENIIQKIATFFKVKNFEEIDSQQKITFKEYINFVIEKMALSLITNSFVFIDIFCNIDDASDIDLFIPWFIKMFWEPLTKKTENLIGDYDGIKIIAIINSDWKLKERLLTDELLLPYINKNDENFSKNKLTTLPLTNWTEGDISNWLRDRHRSLTVSERNKKASKIYRITDGSPNDVCLALKEEGLL